MSTYRVPVLEEYSYQEPVLNMGLYTAPGSPSDGDRYVVGAGNNAGNVWEGHTHDIAWFKTGTGDNGWNFDSPDEGWEVYDLNTHRKWRFNGTNWETTNAEDAGELLIGTPTDMVLSDGLLPFSSSTPIADAIDEVNEILADLAPAMPTSLQNLVLDINKTLYTGKLCAGLPAANWYDLGGSSGAVPPGSTITTVITDDNVIMTSSNAADAFAYGDIGKLIAQRRVADDVSFSDIATLDIDANFEENAPGTSPPRPPQQILDNWNNAGTGDTPVNGVIAFVAPAAGAGNLEVTSVEWYNEFNKWQKMNVRINSTLLQPGYNAFKLYHQMSGISDQESETRVFYYDDDDTAMTFSSGVVLSAEYPYIGYLSGVQYYKSESKFQVNFVGSNVYSNIYADIAAVVNVDGVSTSRNLGPITPPLKTDTISGDGVPYTINESSFYTTQAQAHVQLLHPFKSSVTASSPTTNKVLINTYINASTETQEYFVDEQYRLKYEDGGVLTYDTSPIMTGQWDSTIPLGANDALVYNERVQKGDHDFSSGFLPSQTVNYNDANPNSKYVRAFRKINTAKNSVTLTCTGLDLAANLAEVGSGNVNIEIKLPTETGWLDAGKMYASGTFTGVDGDGCQTSISGNNLNLTFGTFSTANSDWMIVVRITFIASGRAISQLSVNW